MILVLPHNIKIPKTFARIVLKDVKLAVTEQHVIPVHLLDTLKIIIYVRKFLV